MWGESSGFFPVSRSLFRELKRDLREFPSIAQ
ncbi:protein of unknown function [Azospirillum baldaniorum]|uniref:Uncharacterized protein n=1 Tax=Azospirillum baldaniorum TaxID=1064539 RepID=A0A9P1JRT8_9PROT|nr:protein of unknown function [Azospirillum baldaniorum]